MSQYILDSDSASNYIDTRLAHPALRKRILGLPPETMFIIAAIALARGYIVVTGNLRDFAGIPGLACEDWTRDENETESA